MANNLLRALVDLRDRQVQKARIQFSNRLSALERGADDGHDSGQEEIVERWFDRFRKMEDELDADIAEIVPDHPFFMELSAVRGIGPMYAAKLLAMIDIERAETVSALWRYAGCGVVDGKAERPVKGEPLHFNKRLKVAVYLVAGSFLKCNSPYRAIYDSAREYYAANRLDWTKGHQHYAALRKMAKVFLAHLWERWRMLEGLPTRSLYVHEKLGHNHRYSAEEFGWPQIADGKQRTEVNERAESRERTNVSERANNGE